MGGKVCGMRGHVCERRGYVSCGNMCERSEMKGNVCGMRGDVSGMRGDVCGLRGHVSRGNIPYSFSHIFSGMCVREVR